MALTLRRRAVCALALLALLCGCCASFVCGANAEKEVDVPVEVSCPDTNDNKLRWRVAGKGRSEWKECPQAVTDAGSSDSAAYSNTLCFVAGSVFLGNFTTGGCSPSTTDGGTNEVVVFTMNCTAAANSALHKLSKSENVTISPTDNPLGGSGDCKLPTPSQPAAEVDSELQPQGQQQPAHPPQQQPAGAAAASPSARTHDGDRTRNGGSTAAVGEQPHSGARGGSQEPSAEVPRETTTPSVGTAATPTQTAGDRAADGTTTTTTRSPSDGNDADSSANIAAAWMRAPLMLLLTAALACAAA
ncbi:putative mucin-like glycoprotein [Trypanosoma conorhini]|uniref:Putative mucin-like glycoprotein n=1 Tax=Trypanosoma conorhini TaxID=83891 RepID=A0A422MPB4_9TRYP|nr:putative mucin-like glycoprotein [Trypanosoma conorhini]RNE95013.1 putative mucin-like glycoprotein [Trypanosoma conorhini]